MTSLCVPIFVDDVEQTRRDMLLAAEHGADFVELRCDTFTDIGKLDELLVMLSATQLIVTCRPTWEGGKSQLTDEKRLSFLNEMAGRFIGYIDVEQRAAAPLLAQRNADRDAVIVSFHDFVGRPERLYNLIDEMNRAPGDVNKIVWTARSIRDNIEAFEVLLQRQKPTVALCMGEAGLLSRVLAKKFGAFLTFASLGKDKETAPGQITIQDLKTLYRWDAISASTKVYGVIGSPVAQSMSPAIHNAAFDAVGFDGVYLPLLVNEGYESFKAFMETFLAFKPLHLRGLSITIPHKENALRYLKEVGAEVEPLAERIGALNTIVIDPSADTQSKVAVRGFSTDYAAILDCITAALGIERQELHRFRVAVIGAGGTGRTAVAALSHYGATVVVYNRTRERADILADEFNGKTGKVVSAAIDKLCDSCCHVYINTTSVGMSPNIDASPFGDRPPKLTSDNLVFDTIYNPIKTRLLQQAEQTGAKTISGVEMFVRQAVGQFEAWTGLIAPRELMHKVVTARLSRR